MTKLASLDPATGEVVGEVEVTPVEDIAPIVARARAAQRGWAATSIAARCEALAPLAQRLLARAAELSALVSREMGKTARESQGEIGAIAEGIPHELAEIASALAPETLDDGKVVSTIHHDPFGVCAAITPWNFPVAMPHWMVFPALAAGNSVVLKPSEETPLSGQAYADLFAGLLPPDVLQVVHGADAQGTALVAADVDLIAFTGSRAAGKHIMAAAAAGLKRIILELGGKDPLVVLDSADVDRAAVFAARNSYRNAGQMCIATERILVQRAVADRFVARLAAETAKTTIGPMVNARQRDHVLRQLADALAHGAKVVTGGSHEGLQVQPTLLVDVTPEMDISREETFGPIACVTVIDTDDEAVRLANDTPYGLGAVVFGADDERTAGLARRLDAGMVGVNQGVYGARGTPWVGARESGYSFHSGRAGHRNFTQTRVLSRPR